MVMMLPGPQFDQDSGGLWKILQALELYNSVMEPKGGPSNQLQSRGTKLDEVLNRESGAFERRMAPQLGQGSNLTMLQGPQFDQGGGGLMKILQILGGLGVF